MPGEMYEYSLWCRAKAQARVKEKHTTNCSSARKDATNDEDYDNNDSNDSDNADASLVNDVDTDDSDIDDDDDSVHSDDNIDDTSTSSNMRQRTDNNNAAGQSSSTNTTISSSTGGIVIDEYTAIAYSREGSQVGNRIDLRRVSATVHTHVTSCKVVIHSAQVYTHLRTMTSRIVLIM
jgi:hypothetical protein